MASIRTRKGQRSSSLVMVTGTTVVIGVVCLAVADVNIATAARGSAFMGWQFPRMGIFRAGPRAVSHSGASAGCVAPIQDACPDTFEGIVNEGKPFVVDFTHKLCGPCKIMSEVLDDVEDEFAGQVRVLKLPVNRHGALAQGFGVKMVPTLLLFHGGSIEPVGAFVGVKDGEDISAAIRQKLLA